MPALQYPMDKIEPPRLAVFLNHCAATCEWWYVIECRVSNISRSDDDEDDIVELLERYFDQFSSGPREIARNELERFLHPRIQFEDLCLAGSSMRLAIDQVAQGSVYNNTAVVVNYHDTADCFICSSDVEILRCVQQLAPDFKFLSDAEWRTFLPW